MDSLIWPHDPHHLLASVLLGDGRDWHKEEVARSSGSSGGDGNGGRHAGKRRDAGRSFQSKANFEDLSPRVRYLCDLFDVYWKLPPRRCAEFCDALLNVGRANIGGYESFRHVRDDVNVVDILKADDGIVCDDVLSHVNEPLGDNAVVGSAQCTVAKLELRLCQAAFEPANSCLLAVVIFLGRAVGCLSLIVIRP